MEETEMERLLKPYNDHSGKQDDPYILWKREDYTDFLLIPHPEGAWYTNQTGGCACHHPSVRAYAIPYGIPSYLQREMYNEYSGIGEQTAAECDRIMERNGLPFTVDRERLHESEEAWLWVRSTDGAPALLTWENSD